MQRLILLGCLTLICGASAQGDGVLNPRGARPVEHATRGDKCASQKEWPFCTSDEWGPKCPSGCRIQGLMDKEDHSVLKKIEKIRSLLNQNTARHRNADDVSKQTYDYLKDKLVVDSGNDNNYYDLAQNLRRRITEMKIKIDRQLRILANLKDTVRNQVLDIQRLEVDIDMKLRSCKGSCQGYSEFSVDQESYVSLEKQMNQLDNLASQGAESVGTLYVMKSRPLQDVIVSDVYKSRDIGSDREEQKADMFPEVKTVHLVLEEEGSSSSPATVSKDPVCVRLKRQNQDGRRPRSHTSTYRTQQCRAEAGVGLCSDDDWVLKCPSGCRLQGLISQMENEAETKLRRVCKTAKVYEDAAEKTMKKMTNIYTKNRRAIVSRHASELKFVERAEELARNLTSLRKRSSKLSRHLKELRQNVHKQIEDLYRAEVDVDMKLRACHGSCRSVSPFSVDHYSYQTLQADMDLMDRTLNRRRTAAAPPEDIPSIKLQPVDVGMAPSEEYKSIPAVQRELLTQFEDLGQNQVVLEELLEESEDFNPAEFE